MVSNKFLGAVAVKLGLHPHLRHFSTTLQAQITTYAEEITAGDPEAEDSTDSWTTTNDPPKVCYPVPHVNISSEGIYANNSLLHSVFQIW